MKDEKKLTINVKKELTNIKTAVTITPSAETISVFVYRNMDIKKECEKENWVYES